MHLHITSYLNICQTKRYNYTTFSDFYGMKEEEIRKIFAQNLKIFRKEKKISQLALAEAAEVTANFINDIENCKKWVSPMTLSKLCEALEVEPYKFFLPIQIPNDTNSTLLSQFGNDIINQISNIVQITLDKYNARK